METPPHTAGTGCRRTPRTLGNAFTGLHPWADSRGLEESSLPATLRDTDSPVLPHRRLVREGGTMERQRQRHRDRDRDRETAAERDRDRETEKERETETERDRGRDRERDKETETKT